MHGQIFGMDTFFKLKTTPEVFQIIDRFQPVGLEAVPLDEAEGRVAGADVLSPQDLPGFLRSAMDGYALRARDTFGASESLPALLELKGEVLMGQSPSIKISKGEAMKIATGGMLPEGADGVVMVEYCQVLDEGTLEVNRAIVPLENVILPDDDFKKGAIVIQKGRPLRCQDVGALAGLGQTEVSVYRKPKVAIISTGDEVVPIHTSPRPGQVRDINRYTLGAFCRRIGAEPLALGLCKDDFDSLKGMVAEGLAEADTVWISGGSSVGTRDLTLRVLDTLGDFELLVHGISISPGKPTIIGKSGEKPVIGLPGHVSSALIVAEIFLTRLIGRLSGLAGEPGEFQAHVEAYLSRNIESKSGREDYIRVKLFREEDRLLAEPIFGKSGLISILVESDGLIRVGMNTEGLYEGDLVGVMLFESPNRRLLL